MAILANHRALLAALLLAGAAPAMAQPVQEAPKSLLPDIFDEPAAPPPPTVIRPPEPVFAPPPPLETPEEPAESAAAEPPPDPLANLVGPVLRPEEAGLLNQFNGGLGANLFDGSDGRYLGTLLRRIDAPLAGRWMQILLGRALLTRAAPPADINPGDWLAARGEALVAMGQATDAHRMIAQVLTDRYTAGLYAVAGNAAIAAGDPLALCPLSATARSFLDNPFWLMADAMCNAMLGDELGASQLFDRLRARRMLADFDIGLAERLSSAVSGGQRGANPEWDSISALSAWRIGMTSAAGLALPESLLAKATPAQKAWLVRLPGQSLATRAGLVAHAAATGAISSAEANRLLAASATALDPSAMRNSPGGEAQRAWAGTTQDDRLAAIRALLSRGAAGSAERYGWQIAGAASAARITPTEAALEDAPAIVGALLAAGRVAEARRWWAIADDADASVRAAIWAQLAPADASLPADNRLYGIWAEDADPHRAALLAAGLRGLGRGEVGEASPVIDNVWTAALQSAADNRRRGEVLILAAAGMQFGWAQVPPDYLRRMAAALVAVGFREEAGLLVAEAAMRH